MKEENSAVAEWLAPYDRRFVDKNFAISGWDDIKPLFERLESVAIDSVESLENWILNWAEAKSLIDEYASRAYVDMTCQTDDEEKKNAFLYIVQEVEPKATECENRLEKKFLDSPYRSLLPKDIYERLDLMISTSVNLFTEENIPINVTLAELSQKYQALSGSLMVEFDGEEKTMQQMGVYLKDSDRAVRESAFRKSYERRLKEVDQFEKIFDEMVPLRDKFAKNLGLADYQEYAFRSKLRDYSVKDCENFHDAIEATVVPLVRKINERRRVEMKLDTLKPWDTSCDPLGRPPLKPFETSEQLFDGVSNIFEKVDPRLGARFKSIGYSMDLDSRKGKAPGGYQTTFEEIRIPFIFTNAVGLHDDVNTLLHEGGHAFHTLMCRDNPLPWYRHASMEFSEVASMTMELIGADELSVFYSGEESINRVKRARYESIVSLFSWVARVDAFQSWIYTNPTHTGDDRAEKWLSLSKRFDASVDWDGVPKDVQRYLWHRQLHIFEVPFYYVEYAIAQLGALQIYQRYRKDRKTALDDYLSALTIGGSKPAGELFRAAGIRFDFSKELLAELMGLVTEELAL